MKLYRDFRNIYLNFISMKQTEALEVLLSGENCFLTGDAGTGKSWTIQDFIKRSR